MNFGSSASDHSSLQLPESVSNAASTVKSTLSSVGSAFSGNSGVSSEFADSNTIVAKIMFVLLILIAFIVFFRVGVYIIVWIMSPPSNPYLIYGLIDGQNAQIFEQDVAVPNSVFVPKSNDAQTGQEFTWTLWLYVNNAPKTGVYAHVFNKGNNDASNDIIANGITNISGNSTQQLDAPGLYIGTTNSKATVFTSGSAATSEGSNGNTQISLYITMSNYSNLDITPIQIDGVPLRRWVSVIIRLENLVLDVYVQGTIAKRHNFGSSKEVPKQSYGNVFVCQNGGFSGSLSNLRYYSSALSVFAIQNIVYWGPNLTAAAQQQPAGSAGSNVFFLDRSWYASKYV